MRGRRAFLISAPLGLAGLAAGCGDRSDRPQTSGAIAPGDRGFGFASAAAPRNRSIGRADAHLDAGARDLVYTFGGAAPKHHIEPGTRIVSWTEDCFDGAVKTAADLPSKVMAPGHDNPQTGPFFIEGAEPGDTVAVHILKLEPARDYAVSSFFPGFGAHRRHRPHGDARARPSRNDVALRSQRAIDDPRAHRAATASTRGTCRSRRSSGAWASRPR